MTMVSADDTSEAAAGLAALISPSELLSSVSAWERRDLVRRILGLGPRVEMVRVCLRIRGQFFSVSYFVAGKWMR